MDKQQLLEKSALVVSVLVLVTAVWVWTGQLNDVHDFLELIEAADG